MSCTPDLLVYLMLALSCTSAMLVVSVLLFRSDIRDDQERVHRQWSDELLKRGHTNEKLCRYLEKLLGEDNPNG